MKSALMWKKIQARCQRDAARYLSTRHVSMRNAVPIISFTFDDFPKSSLHVGGGILKSFGYDATYYVSMGLMGKLDSAGEMFSQADLLLLSEQGHELGCHTFDHYPAWETKPDLFEKSILDNKAALEDALPGTSLQTFSYPISEPRPKTKQITSKYFRCSRGGGQAVNAATMDLNYLKAYFLDARRSDLTDVRMRMEENSRSKGWLIFATHDISDAPTAFGCTPDFFHNVVRSAARSGARILPVTKALAECLAQP
jgi:peptidoglycan/xylan/chitin deacetylase (PgdA/CDA1 family)